MDYHSIAAVALGTGALVTAAGLYRWSVKLPQGGEDEALEYVSFTPTREFEPTHAIYVSTPTGRDDAPLDWTKPLELSPETTYEGGVWVRSVRAPSDLPALSYDQRAVLLQLSGEIGWKAATLVKRTGLPHKRVVEASKQLAAKGLAKLVYLANDMDGTAFARGYILTVAGCHAQDALQSECAA